MEKIPYGRQNITKADIDSVVEVLKSDYLTQGPKIKEFEDSFSNFVNSKYAISVSNGTAGLHLCCMALGVNESTNVITTPITFSATANSVRYCGGNVYFADIDPDTYLIDIESVKRIIKSKPKNYFSGIIVVDFAGYAVDNEKFKKLADQFNLWIIEDACHAPGGFFIDSNNKKHKCGNSHYTDFSVFSFHPVKHIATGEGGMITTNNKEYYNRILKLRTHGIERSSNFENSLDEASGVSNASEYPLWYMEMQDLGYNYRLTDIQAVLGNSQLKRLNKGLKKRKEIAKKYVSFFSNKKYVIRYPQKIFGHAFHLFVLEVEQRLGLYNFLRKNGILSQIHYFPVNKMPYYKKIPQTFNTETPNSFSYYNNCISLPIFPELSDQKIEFICKKVDEFYS